MTESSIWDFTLASHYAYLAVADHGLQIWDIANPSAAIAVGFAWLPAITSIKVFDHYAYASDADINLTVFDIANPAKLRKLATYPALGDVTGMAVANGFAYLPAGKALRIMRMANTGALTLVGSYPTDSLINQITVVDKIAYLATNAKGLLAMDVSAPTTPILIGQFTTPAAINDVVVQDGYAFMAVDKAGIYVVDVADPTQMQEVEHYQTPDSAQQLTVVAERIYVADWLGGLLILEFTPPD